MTSQDRVLALVLLFSAVTGTLTALALWPAERRLAAARRPTVGAAALRIGWIRTEAWLRKASLPLPPAQFAQVIGLTTSLLGCVGALALTWYGGLALAMLCLWATRLYVRQRIARRSAYAAAELPTFLRLTANRIRTGFSLAQALELATRDGPPLIGEEMRQAITEVNMGASLEDALDRLRARIANEDVDLAVTAMLISREVGGNLTQSLHTLADTVNERARLRRQIRVLTAQPRLSGAILSVLPFLILGALTLVQPEFVMVMFAEPLGWLLILCGLISESLGILLIRRILRAGEELLS